MNNEIVKLVNVLRRIARAASYASWVKAEADAARFCATQYNRVLARLNELEPNTRALFAPLPEQAPPDVTRIAARDLAAYFEDDAPEPHAWKFAWGCRPVAVCARAGCVPVSARCE